MDQSFVRKCPHRTWRQAIQCAFIQFTVTGKKRTVRKLVDGDLRGNWAVFY